MTLEQTKNYRGNLKLQQMSELDADVEDRNTLLTQNTSIKGYLKKLSGACSDIMAHYDERK